MNHEQTAFHRLASYFGQSDIAFGVWICAIAVLTIVVIGYGCVRLSTAPAPEGDRKQ